MNIQNVTFCNVIVIDKGAVFVNELILGYDYDTVMERANTRLVERIKEIDADISEADMKESIAEGYWKSDTQDVSVCISSADIFNENILE